MKFYSSWVTFCTIFVIASTASISTALDLDVNFAVAGAFTDDKNVFTECFGGLTKSCAQVESMKTGLQMAGLELGGLSQQINYAASALTDVDPDQDVFLLYAGANDFIGPYPGWAGETPPPFQQVASPNPYIPYTAAWSVNNLGLALERIYSELNGKHIILLNYGDMTKAPNFMKLLNQVGATPSQIGAAQYFASIWNGQFDAGMNLLVNNFNTQKGNSNAMLFDVGSVGNSLLNSGNFEVAPKTCKDELYSNPLAHTDPENDGYDCQNYAWVDNVHPTSLFWTSIAKDISDYVTSETPGITFRRLITFGDSVSDTGTQPDIFARAFGLPGMLAPYFDNRWVNGLTLSELIEQNLGTQSTTFYSRPSSITPAPTGSASGDPHFKTWSGERYDFHGVCDLVLLYNPGFDDGLGMDIHIRTKRVRRWSYISSAVLRIGDDSLEVMGGSTFEYWINGVKQQSQELLEQMDKINDSITLDQKLSGRYNIRFKKPSKKSDVFEIELGSKNNNEKELISISAWHSFVRVDFVGATYENFETSMGLMGSFVGGLKMGRNNQTIVNDINEFGQEWQVLPEEPKLFHDPLDGPHLPHERCEIPSVSDMRRRLATSTINIHDAELACSHVSDEEERQLCIFDVIATDGEEVAGAY